MANRGMNDRPNKASGRMKVTSPERKRRAGPATDPSLALRAGTLDSRAISPSECSRDLGGEPGVGQDQSVVGPQGLAFGDFGEAAQQEWCQLLAANADAHRLLFG